jgi:tripartite ATP-independent transporter DctM subunit
MSPVVIGLVGFLLLFALLANGMSIGFAMALIGFLGMCILFSVPVAIAKMAMTSYHAASDYSLAVLPLFLLMAHVVFQCGFGDQLFRVAEKWVGRLRGGLAMGTIGACSAFGAVSGSSLATAATVGLIALPEMKKKGYDDGFAAGAVAAGGTMGALTPPSGMLIIYGVLTETSIGKLFAGAIIPAVITALGYVLTIYIMCRIHPNYGPPARKVSFKEKVISLKDCWEVFALVFFCIGGIIFGWFTPTEAGGAGAGGAILLGVVRRKLTWAKLRVAFSDAMATAGMIYGIVIGAFIFNYFVAKTNLPQAVGEWVVGLHAPPMVVVAIIAIIYILLATIMEGPSIQLLTLPIFFPLLMGLGFDPVWFGIIQCRLLELGLIVPPLGMCMFVVAGLDRTIPLTTIFKGCLSFLAMDIVTMPIFMYFPQTVLWLPSVMK